MNRRLLRLLALSSGLAFPSMLEGASSRLELAGGWSKPASTMGVTESPAAPVRPLAPGEILVLGPTAAPLSAPTLAPALPLSTSRPPAPSPEVDTVTVSAISSLPSPASPAAGAPRSPAPGAGWETYRTGKVVRIALP